MNGPLDVECIYRWGEKFGFVDHTDKTLVRLKKKMDKVSRDLEWIKFKIDQEEVFKETQSSLPNPLPTDGTYEKQFSLKKTEWYDLKSSYENAKKKNEKANRAKAKRHQVRGFIAKRKLALLREGGNNIQGKLRFYKMHELE